MRNEEDNLMPYADAEGGVYDLEGFDRALHGGYYAGNAGKKYGIVVGGQRWLVKFPASAKGMENATMSYTASPVSEHIGSRIYATLGIPVHETHLGKREGKIVVACRDFRARDVEFVEFKNVKNSVISDAGGESTSLRDVLDAIAESELLSSTEGVLERFWRMFVVDAFIRNGDRNNTNWAVFVHDSGKTELAPVYDNGNAFFNKRDAAKMQAASQDASRLRQDAIDTNVSRYLDEDGRPINPFEFLAATDDADALEALDWFCETVDMDKVHDVLDGIPEKAYGLDVLPDEARTMYSKMLDTTKTELEHVRATRELAGHARTPSEDIDRARKKKGPDEGGRVEAGGSRRAAGPSPDLLRKTNCRTDGETGHLTHVPARVS